MSVSLLRQAPLNCTKCFTTQAFRPRRLYAQMALAHAPVDRSQLSGNHEQAGPSAFKQSQTKEGQSQELTGSSKPKRPSRAKKSGGDSAPRKDPLAATGLELYLQQIHDSGLEPTLSDIERCRPERHAENVDSPQYADEYNVLVDKLCRSFSRQQLREFTILFKLSLRATVTKHQLAESIIEKQWKWPSLKEVQKRHRDRTEVSVKSFPVDPTQLFLLLGKDGAELLQISKDYNVHIAVTHDPLSLRVEGLRVSLNALSEHMTMVKNAIVEDTFELPGGKPIKQGLVQPISRLANAYVQNLGDKGMVRIYAKHRRDLDAAKRFVTRAAFESAEASRTTLLSYLPTGVASSTTMPRVVFPYTYSVYPFLSPRSLPWTMKGGGAFRIRRVIEWLGVNSHEDIQATGGLAGGRGRIMNIDDKELTLKDTLFGELPGRNDDTATSRIVTASFGHVLLPSTSSQRASIIPPFEGFWPFAKILAWLKQSRPDTTFVPSLPIQLLNSAPKQQKILLRIFYHAISESSGLSEAQRDLSRSQPTKLIKFEVVLAHSQPAEKVSRSGSPVEVLSQLKPETERKSEHVMDDAVSLINSDETAADPKNDISTTESRGLSPQVEGFVESIFASDESDTSSDTRESNGPENQMPEEAAFSTSIGPEFSTQPRCWAGVETTASLILPDRPMDIHFAAFDHIALPRDREPEELQSYSSALQSFLQGQGADGEQPSAPTPPGTFMHNGETYVLHKSFSIRQSDEAIPGLIVGDSNAGAELQVVSESILDLESQQKSTVCKVSCIDHKNSDDIWEPLLGHCDRLTSALYAPAGDDGADGKKFGLDID